MKKATNCSVYLNLKVFGITIFLTFCFLTGLHAQDTGGGNIPQYLNTESEDEISAQDPSTEKAQEAAEKKQSLEELLAVAKESESARAYEVTAQLVRTLSDTTKELLELQKSKKEIEKEVKDPQTVNNSLFIGSTKELQDLLHSKKE